MEDTGGSDAYFRVRPTVEFSGLESVEIVDYGCREGRGRECARLLIEDLKTGDRWIGRFCQSPISSPSQSSVMALYRVEEWVLVICGGLAHLLTHSAARTALQLDVEPVCGHRELIAGRFIAVWDFQRIAIVGCSGVCELLDCDEGEVENLSIVPGDDRKLVLEIRFRRKWDGELSVVRRVVPQCRL